MKVTLTSCCMNFKNTVKRTPKPRKQHVSCQVLRKIKALNYKTLGKRICQHVKTN